MIPKTPPPIPTALLDLSDSLPLLRTRDLLTIREIAPILRLSGQSVRLLLKLGDLDGFAYRIGGRGEKARRISTVSLCRYLLASATLTERDRTALLALFVEKLDLRTIDFLLPLLTARHAVLTPTSSS